MQFSKQVEKAFVRQHDQSDCGVACLVTLTRFFGGNAYLSTVREQSGTTAKGTTMLGLSYAADQLGIQAEAYEAEIENLKEQTSPCILHVVVDKYLQHYVICFGYHKGYFTIADPAKGIRKYSEKELELIWQSKALLLCEPKPSFKKAETLHKEKMFWIKKLIEEDLNLLSIALFLGLVIAVLSLSTAIFSQRLIDDILPHNNKLKLVLGLSLLTFLLMVKSGLGYIRQQFLNNQSRSFNNRLVTHFFEKLLFLPKTFFDNRKTGDLTARLNDTSRIQNTISNLISNVMIDVLLIFISSVVILVYSAQVGVLSLLYIPAYFLIVYFFNAPIVRSQREVMAAYAGSESNYIDTIQGIAAIKEQNKEHGFIHQTTSIYDFFQAKILRLGKIRIQFNLVTELVSSLIILAVIAWTSYKVFEKDMKLGEMMAILQMLGTLFPATSRLALSNIQLQEAKVAFDRMFEFTLMPSEYDREKDQENHSISQFERLKVENISFRFPGQKLILNNVSFEISQGEFIVLLGESGVGKSTLLQVIQKFYKIDEGKIEVNDLDWNALSVKGWRGVTAAVPQQVKIFQGNLLTNIAMQEITEEEAKQIVLFCTAYGFNTYFERFPQGYFTLLGEEGVNLSGGQQQLVALARALYKKPQLLILDEPSAAMDRHTENFVLQLLQTYREKTKCAMLMVTHRWKIAKDADQIYILNNGTITEQGNHAELLNGSKYYAELWES